MTPKQRLQIEQSEKRQRLNTLLAEDQLSDEQRSELDGLTRRMQQLEVELRAAIIAEPDPVVTGAPATEDRDRLELRSRARLTNYLVAALQGRATTGAEAELAAEAGVSDASKIPLELFDVPGRVETRADAATPAPATGTGVNVERIWPQIYARSVVPRLGVAMPRVPSGAYSTMTVTTGLSAAAKAKGAAQESTAAALTPSTTTPHRVSARLSLQLEDIASIGVDAFEAVLRQHLMLAMSDRLDHLGLTGQGGNTAEPQGLIPQLTDPTDPTDAVTWATFVSTVAAGIDGGPWAENLTNIMVCANAETMRKAETTFQAGTGTDTPGEQSAAAYLRANTAGFFASARMPATASTIAKAILFRAGTMGLDGVNAMRTATCPVWAEVGIDDIYSDSASGTRHFTLHHLIGDIVIQQPSAYQLIEFKLS